MRVLCHVLLLIILASFRETFFDGLASESHYFEEFFSVPYTVVTVAPILKF
jgi:hypothetical protein